ncbi:4-(cytidine 5'-diphospho)-2-C-methyl-D-erythritol kinase [Citreimonas salinaria]|uniref:4-diphosphocytidyl-2-C-methyl-D-erythritol kinase n=1 Tax=Citreimonas salinaria TaxID=321339 RepID=A0A1H3HQF1_9RHOB|nr:4-(cytidine 5'-diphospho)-2-C-methyl-D-erythritol kinase [Citreimonas salinaria]SDY17662.1 4-diphosphocytidyl-2-C-methyl-D-erythritol kinase [Citreimonas salinaria]
MPTEAFAPAKVNLALHVTGRRDDGYHLLDSLVAFADIGDRIAVAHAPETRLTVTGPRAGGVPADARNLCWRAAELHGTHAHITLEKHLPAAAGIGGGSSDAAATLRALEALTGRGTDFDPLVLGADLPVCLYARAARMQGIGEALTPLDLPPLPAVLVNPGVEVPTGPVFAALPSRENPPMTDMPVARDRQTFLGWLAAQRNDLQAPAIGLQPVIAQVIDALRDADLARMSGSGATCFGLYPVQGAAERAAGRIAARHPGWWTAACTLG